MANFVLVHAAWHGGWEWRRVAQRLRAAGHEVFTPTLTGCGERSHLLSRDIGLDTHLRDVGNLILWEDLQDVVLAGHSYSGTVVTGVADQLSERIRARVYFDAFVPRDGQSTMDLTPDWRKQEIIDLARTDGEGWYVPPHHAERWVSDPEDRAWLQSKVTAQPLKSLTDPVHLTGAVSRVPGIYVLSAAFKPSPFWQFYEALQAAPGWRLFQLPTLHDAMISMPDEVTAILQSAAGDA